MAFVGDNISLTEDGVTLVYEAQSCDIEVWFNSYGGTQPDYYIGDSSVDDLNGLLVHGEETFHTKVRPGDKIYAHTNASNHRLTLLVRSA